MKLGGFVLLFVILAFPFVSSTIVIDDDFDDLYNVGDLVELNFSVLKDYEVSGFVEVLLKCDSDEFVLKKDYISLEKDRKKYIYLESPLAIEGDCRIEVSFLNDEERSIQFEVSDGMDIGYSLNDRFFLPGELLVINGTVEKRNGEDYDGLLKVKIDDLDEKTIEVIDGDFYFEYEIKDGTSPGEYYLDIVVEERDFTDKIINSGRARDEIKVKRKASLININGLEEISPPYEFYFNVELLDQVGTLFSNETIVVKLMNPLGDIVFQDEVLSGDNISYNFSSNAMKGGWNIKSYYGNIVSIKPIYIDTNKEIKSYLIGNVFHFENLGNVPYEGIVNFALNNDSFDEEIYMNISVPIGGIYKYPVRYVGDYNVSLNGEDYGLVHLTGYSVLIGDFEKNNYFVLGGVLIFLFLVLFFVFKKKFFGVMRNNEHRIRSKKQERLGSNKDMKEVQTRKLVVKEKSEENKSVLRKNYILFIESSIGIDDFENIVKKYGFKLSRVEENLGYVLFFNSKNMNTELKLYNLAKTVARFSEIKNAKTSIVINRGLFENKLTLLKKFALLNRRLLSYCDGKILMTKKFFDFLNINVNREVKRIVVMEKELEVCLV